MIEETPQTVEIMKLRRGEAIEGGCSTYGRQNLCRLESFVHTKTEFVRLRCCPRCSAFVICISSKIRARILCSMLIRLFLIDERSRSLFPSIVGTINFLLPRLDTFISTYF